MVQAFPDGGTLRSNRLLHRMAIRSHPAVPGGRRKGHKTGLNFRWGDWWGFYGIGGVWWWCMVEIEEMLILGFRVNSRPVFRRRAGLPSKIRTLRGTGFEPAQPCGHKLLRQYSFSPT